MNYPANTAGGSSSGQPPVNDTRYVAPPPPPPGLGLDMQYGPGGFYSQGSAHLYGTGSVSAYGPPMQYPVGRYMSSLDLHGAIQGSVCLPTGQPISTTSTTPAVFVNTKDQSSHILPVVSKASAAMSELHKNQDIFARAAALPNSLPNAIPNALPNTITNALPPVIEPQHSPRVRNESEVRRGRGRGRGRGARHRSPRESSQSPAGESPQPSEDGGLKVDVVLTMEDLLTRGIVTRVGEQMYQIPSDLLHSGRSSITIGAAIGGDKRRFNLKWLYDYRWLRFDPGENSMLCALCKQGRRANQFAKLGSKNFKTSALADHTTSNDHKRSLAQLGPVEVVPDCAIALIDGVWAALPYSAPEPRHQVLEAAVAHMEVPRPASARAMPLSASVKTSPAAAPALTITDGALEAAVGARNVAQPSASATSYSTIDSLSSTASRITPVETHYAVPKGEHAGMRSLERRAGGRPRAGSGPLLGMAHGGDGQAPRSSASAVPDERYAKEFEHAVQALLQAMNLNLPISSVADLYQLQTRPRPLADIGSHGHASRGGRGDVRLAGAYTNSTEAARTLQHVVSSELLSLIKDEVSQSPAFSVIIDEAPLREHNSLVAHVLLYLRYMRRDPESESGELQAITRFWRCVHLYHEDGGRLARRDPISLVLTLLERAKIDSSRLVCISCERPASREDEEAERWRQPHVIHWHGIFTYPHSLSPQLYEEITNRSEDFVHFSMALMDLCLFMYSHPTSFAFLGVDFQEMLYKTLYEIFLDEGSINTRLPISLTPAIVIALTRNISQIMATVLALSRVVPSAAPRAADAPGLSAGRAAGVNMPDHRAGDGAATLTPKSPRSSLQIPLPVIDILVSSFGGRLGAQKSVGRCPPADVLLERLRDYSFLGCLHFMADILLQIKPIIDIAGHNDMPTRVLGALSEPADHTLDQRLRAYIGTIRDAIESVTIMYGEEEGDEHHDAVLGAAAAAEGEEEFLGFHLNEFMHLTDKEDLVCRFRSFTVVNYSRDDSQSRLIELIRTVSSAILHDLHQRFNANDIATVQALADMWDPTQFPRDPQETAAFANRQALELTSRMSGAPKAEPIDAGAVLQEWGAFKAEVHHRAEAELGPLADVAVARYVPGKIQLAYRAKLFPNGALAPSGRRLRSVEDGQRANMSTQTSDQSLLEHLQRHTHAAQPPEARSKFGHLAKLATAWNVLPLALSTDLHFFRRFYERQLARICREQAENKLQSINFDIGDTFSELLGRVSSPLHKKKRVTVYDLLQNSKVEVERNIIGSLEKPVEVELSGVTVDYFVRSIDAVTMALDHRLRLLSLEFTESPIAVSKTPGDCPKWMQNAMRGYWKLACRPPKPPKTPAVAPVSHGVRHRTHTTSNVSVAGGNAPWSTCTTNQMSDHPEFEPSDKQCGLLTSASAPASVPPMPELGGGLQSVQTSVFKAGTSYTPMAMRADTAQQLSISAAVCATIQPAASDDLSTLPLLEALLSDPGNVPAPPPPPQSQAAKRPLDAGPPATSFGEPAGPETMMAAVAAANKRMRHSADGSMAAAAPFLYDRFNYPGFADPGVFQQAAAAKEEEGGETFGTAIARLASDMGLDSASTQAFAASLSGQLMQPPPSTHMDNAGMLAGIPRTQPPAYQRYSQQQQFQPHIHRPGSATSLQGLVPGGGGDGMSYAAAQLVFASQAAAMNMHGMQALPPGPMGGMSRVQNAMSFDQIMHEQRLHMNRQQEHAQAPPPPPPNAFDYHMRGFLPDNNNKQ